MREVEKAWEFGCMDVDNTGTGGGCMAGMEVVMDMVDDRAGNG